MVTRAQIHEAMAPKPWDLSNEILYRLCRENPTHVDIGPVLAKMVTIGRVYAAAIERRKVHLNVSGDLFYIKHVAPQIIKSSIDQWIQEAQTADPHSTDGLATMVRVHKFMTDVFTRISGEEKRSLASKYLHFHAPRLFYIY